MLQKNVTPQEVASLFDYHPETGDITWKDAIYVRRDRRGKPVGYKYPYSYIVVRIQGRNYPAHHVAWCLHYGDWAPSQIRHLDGDKHNNRISNLDLMVETQSTPARLLREAEWHRNRAEQLTARAAELSAKAAASQAARDAIDATPGGDHYPPAGAADAPRW